MRSIDTYPPAVKQHPVIQLLRYSFRPLSFLEDCAQLGETFCFRLPGFGRLVMLTRPEDIREAFRGDPAVLHAGEGNRLLSSLVGETSVLVLDDAPHVRQRRILLPPLKGERMRLFFDAMQSEALATADDWLQRGDVRVILRTVLGVDKGADFDELEQSLSRLLNVSRHALVLILYNLFPPERFENSNVLPFYRLRRRFDTRLFDIIAGQRRLPAAERPAGLLSDLLATSHEDGVPRRCRTWKSVTRW